jgi:hypothetical protein
VTSVLDLWRWLDPAARLVPGSSDRLGRPVRGVGRTRAAPPHLPPLGDGQLLVVDGTILADPSLDPLLAAIGEAGLDPAAIWIAGAGERTFEAPAADLPIIAGDAAGSDVERRAAAHLEHERDELATLAAAVRLAAAEAALADPQVSAPAGVVAARLRRGTAVSVGGDLASVNPRPAGRALATRFVAAHARLPAGRAPRSPGARHTPDGLWVLERSIEAAGTHATAWLFDDLPFARVDEVALDALAITLRALLRRRPPGRSESRAEPRVPPSTGDALHDTLLAVARANGRIAPAARALGVHRNTVLYRLRRASAELGVDPRRPEDALRLLRSSEEA